VGAGAAAAGGIVYYRVKLHHAYNQEDAAYDQELQAIHNYNLAMLAHPGPLPLAGRKRKPGEFDVWCRKIGEQEVGNGDKDCIYECTNGEFEFYESETITITQECRPFYHYVWRLGPNE
jgi:hypothetical protein